MPQLGVGSSRTIYLLAMTSPRWSELEADCRLVEGFQPLLAHIINWRMWWFRSKHLEKWLAGQEKSGKVAAFVSKTFDVGYVYFVRCQHNYFLNRSMYDISSSFGVKLDQSGATEYWQNNLAIHLVLYYTLHCVSTGTVTLVWYHFLWYVFGYLYDSWVD